MTQGLTVKTAIGQRIGTLLVAATAALGIGSGGLTGEEVLRKVEDQVNGVRDFTVALDVVADIERIKVPPMRAKMYYKQPDKVHFDSKGFAMLPRESMGLQFGHLSQRYAVDSVQRQTKETPVLYRVVMHPRDEQSRVRRVVVWIDGERWTPERLEIPEPGGRSMSATFTYGNFQGFWLPTALTVQFEMLPQDSTAIAPANPFATPDTPARNPQRTNPRTGKISVRYSAYQVNTGLKDEIFVKPEEPKSSP